MAGEPDGFVGIFGSRRGWGSASLAIAEPSFGARRHLERILASVRRGDLVEALEELAGPSCAVESAPLLDDLHRAVAEALLDEGLHAWEASITCLFDVTGLPPSLLGSALARERLIGLAQTLLAQALLGGLPLSPAEARSQMTEGLDMAIINTLALAVMALPPSHESLRVLGIPDKGSGAPLGIIPLEAWRDLLCHCLPAAPVPESPGASYIDMVKRAFEGNVRRVVGALESGAGDALPLRGRYERRRKG